MGTGVGEAALAAEAIGAAEAAGAIGGGAGFLEGMAGVSALEGAGVAGLGLGTGAGLGTGLAGAGGLGALSPAFQTALGETAVFNPEIAAQTAQFANVGALPSANAALGAGQIGDPALLQTLGQGAGEAATQTLNPVNYLQDVNATMDLNIRPEDVVDAETVAPKAATPATPTPPREPGMYTAEPGWASKTAPTTTQGAGGIGDILKNATQPLQNWWDDQNTLTKYGLGGYGALQAVKYLNKPQGVAAPEKYNGPLSKFSYSPDTYRPYTYRPYAAGGPVERMSNENAIGANTGYPQADIQHGAYATPWQTPVSRNVVAGAGDVGVDQMTGMERMARGGVAHFEGGGEASGGGDSSAAAGEGNTGIAALGPMMYSPAMMSSSLVDPAVEYAAAQPIYQASRANFQNFITPYQSLPGLSKQDIADWVAAHPKEVITASPAPNYNYDVGPPVGLGSNEAAYDSAAGSPGGGAKAGGLMRHMAVGGISNLGGYSDGGRLLKGPGDGMSDNIPATIGRKQPARLADGEFVVPADVVSGLGNGSTDAGAKQLYKMLDKVRSARTGNKKQGKQINPNKYMPA